jgi:hypothetical protein
MLKSFVVFAVALVWGQSALAQGVLKLLPTAESKPVSTNSSNRAADEPKLKMSDFRGLPSTPYLIAKIQHDDDSKGSFSKVSSGPGGVVNYIFFDTTNDTATTLMPDNNRLIISFDSFSDSPVETESMLAKTSVEQASVATRNAYRGHWHVVEYVSVDTDRDGELTSKDRHALGIADAGGKGFTEVVANLGETFWKKVDGNTLLLIHGSQAKQVAVRIDLQDRKIISSKVLPNFGTR